MTPESESSAVASREPSRRLERPASRSARRHAALTADVAAIGCTVESRRLPLAHIVPNDYNANVMTDREFDRLVVEVKRLQRIPKPIVVRPQASHYEIIDGEHGYWAAKAAALVEVDCDVVSVSDLEAMRQSYQRNQHGKFDSVRLGRLFARMLQAGQLNVEDRSSQRTLAAALNVSHTTVRNYMLYVQAADLGEFSEPEIADLGIREVKALLACETAEDRKAWMDVRQGRKATTSETSAEQRARFAQALRGLDHEALIGLILDHLKPSTLSARFRVSLEEFAGGAA